jgi:hypothetical protein
VKNTDGQEITKMFEYNLFRTSRMVLNDDDDHHHHHHNNKLEQHTRKARYQGTTENRYIGHSTHTAGSANVEARKSLVLKTELCAPLTVRAE